MGVLQPSPAVIPLQVHLQQFRHHVSILCELPGVPSPVRRRCCRRHPQLHLPPQPSLPLTYMRVHCRRWRGAAVARICVGLGLALGLFEACIVAARGPRLAFPVGTTALTLFALVGLPCVVRYRLGATPGAPSLHVHEDVDELLLVCGVHGVGAAAHRDPHDDACSGDESKYHAPAREREAAAAAAAAESEGLALVVLGASGGALVYTVIAAWVGYATDHICYMALLWTLVPALAIAAVPAGSNRRAAAAFAYAVYFAAVLTRAPEFLGPALTSLTRAGALPLAADAADTAAALLLVGAMQLFQAVVTRVSALVAGPSTHVAARFIFVAQARERI